MSFGLKTNKKVCTFLLAGILASMPLASMAQRMEVAELDLLQAKDSFQQVWHAAAETTKKRAELQQNLAQFDTKVASAKRELENAAKERKAVRQKISEKQKLVDAITQQLNAVTELRGFYQAVASTHKESFVRFVRYVSSKNIAKADAGSVVGGSFLRHFMRGSLGESIDEFIALNALVKARQKLGLHVNVLVKEASKTEERLQKVANELDREMSALESDHRSIAQSADEKAAFIDMSWKQKKLTEAELKEVALEAAETNARMQEMQLSLVKINDQLKERKLNGLKDDMKKLEDHMASLQEKKLALERKDDAMRMLEEAVLKAYQKTVSTKNTDKKLYKRIEEKSLALKNAEAILARGTVDHEENIGETRTITEREREKFTEQIATYKLEIAVMKEGVPEDAAVEYVEAKRRADAAKVARNEIAKELDLLKPKFAELQASMSGIAQKVDAVEKEFALGDLPPLFMWPVRGSLTATFFDPDYHKVFGVPHRAIDIAVRQGSVVHAISDGVVFAVRDGGAVGYSYILIGHRNGYASLYGHLSKFLVSKGDVVSVGQPIALSGGTPGTPGAGHMTTGAHLHLEVTKDGVHIDPRSVLK